NSGVNNALDGILAFLRKTDENQQRVEKKLDDFIMLVTPLIKDNADFSKSTAAQLKDFDEWREESSKQLKVLKRALPIRPRPTYLLRDQDPPTTRVW
ncbi:hypothetical protein PENTCL1PPCAC_29865, partial [Pristionchus entomophagus]